MKKKKYLNLYFDWMHYDHFPFLCYYFGEDEMFKMFIPNQSELLEHVADGYGRSAWGVLERGKCFDATPLRQNIVLLMAAMAGEFDKNYEKPRRKEK